MTTSPNAAAATPVAPLARPTIACVIPAYNREDTVARSVRSALSQTRPPEEVIVVDDGSSDATAQVVEALAEEHPGRVRLVRQPNGGAPSARNTGARAATADWIAFLDSDDYFTPEHLERMEEAIQGTEGRAEFYFSDIDMAENEGGRPQWERAGFSIEGRYQLQPDGAQWVVRPRIPMMLQASVFHRERLLAMGGLWEELPMRDDTHVFIRHGLAGAVCAVAHLGTQQTSDDATGGRLTTVISNKTARYWECSILMWSDLLERNPDLAADKRAVLAGRLAVSHMRAARHAARSWALPRAAVHLVRGFAARPATAVSALLGPLGLRRGAAPTG